MSSSPPSPNISILTMQHPPKAAALQLQHIITQLEQRRTRIASLGILKLDHIFFSDLAAAGDVHLLRQVTTLFGCLMHLSYLPGFSKPVDRAVNKLLLHAVMGCEQARLQTQVPGDSLRWLAPREIEIRELLETYRGFFNYITFRESYCYLRDVNLVEARQKLQKLRPRISTLAPWSPEPEPVTPRKSRTQTPKAKRTRPIQMPTPSPTLKKSGHGITKSEKTRKRSREWKQTPSPTHQMELRERKRVRYTTPPVEIPPTECGAVLTVATLILSRPPKPFVQDVHIPLPRFRTVGGAVEEVTQPFDYEIRLPRTAHRAEVSASTQLRKECIDWEERRLKCLLSLSPESTAQESERVC